MGDPRKARKKYQTPTHPWQKKRIEEEKELIKEYGFKSKKEIWKLNSWLKSAQRFIKATVTSTSPQIQNERKMMFDKMISYGLVNSDSQIGDILAITPRDLYERRLQTLVFKKGLAKSIKQARQFIVHKHIMVNGKAISSPNYLVRVSEEDKITFNPYSALSKPDHPERGEIKSELVENAQEENKAESHNAEDSKAQAQENKEKKVPKDNKKKKDNKGAKENAPDKKPKDEAKPQENKQPKEEVKNG